MEDELARVPTRNTAVCVHYGRVRPQASRATREDLVRAEWAECRAELVYQDAENMWGAGWKEQEPVAPTVIGVPAHEPVGG